MVLKELTSKLKGLKARVEVTRQKRELKFNARVDREITKNKRLLERDKLRYQRANINSKYQKVKPGSLLGGGKLKGLKGEVKKSDEYKRIKF